ncbi:MAG: hypothetical protein ABSG64_08295 [Solirubrobacteraceae bacterium]
MRAIWPDCIDASTCLAATGTSIVKTTDGGATWTTVLAAREVVPEHIVDLRDVSCAMSDCVAIKMNNEPGPVLMYSTNLGRSWRTGTLPNPASAWVDAVSCPANGVCYALGLAENARTAILWTTSDGGRAWRLLRVPPSSSSVAGAAGDDEPSGIDCASARFCVAALGPRMLVTRSGPGGFRSVALPSAWQNSSHAGLAEGVACVPRTESCVVVGTSFAHGRTSVLVAWSTNGTRWTPARHVPSIDAVSTGVSCPALDACVIGGIQNPIAKMGLCLAQVCGNERAFLLRSAGSMNRWRAIKLPRPKSGRLFGILGISCGAPRFCVVDGAVISRRPPWVYVLIGPA